MGDFAKVKLLAEGTCVPVCKTLKNLDLLPSVISRENKTHEHHTCLLVMCLCTKCSLIVESHVAVSTLMG